MRGRCSSESSPSAHRPIGPSVRRSIIGGPPSSIISVLLTRCCAVRSSTIDTGCYLFLFSFLFILSTLEKVQILMFSAAKYSSRNDPPPQSNASQSSSPPVCLSAGPNYPSPYFPPHFLLPPSLFFRQIRFHDRRFYTEEQHRFPFYTSESYYFFHFIPRHFTQETVLEEEPYYVCLYRYIYIYIYMRV